MAYRRIAAVAATLVLAAGVLAGCLPKLSPPPANSPVLTVDHAFVTGLGNPWDIGFAARRHDVLHATLGCDLGPAHERHHPAARDAGRRPGRR